MSDINYKTTLFVLMLFANVVAVGIDIFKTFKFPYATHCYQNIDVELC